jgi:predicted small integral membrane protein
MEVAKESSLHFTTTVRLAKSVLIAAMAFFFTLVVFNNITDFQSNYQFVHHVLDMDTTFPGNKGMWRALHPAWTHLFFYLGIIVYEALNMVLCWWAAAAMFRARSATSQVFSQVRAIGVVALTAGILLWLGAFLEVGAEWFLMWQSRIWNGQEAAFRMVTIEGILLVILLLPEDV